MAGNLKIINLSRPTPNGPYQEDLLDIYAIDSGAGSATNDYQITLSSSAAITEGTPVYFKAAFTNTGAATITITLPSGPVTFPITKSGATPLSAGDINSGQIIELISDGTNLQIASGSGSSSSSFATLTGGTNAGQTLDVGNGSILQPVGTGVVDANAIAGQQWTNTASSAGQIPIFDGSKWVPGDPFVQGVFVPGTNVNTGFSGGPIQPVLIGAQNPSNLLANIQVDASGNLKTTGGGTQYSEGTTQATPTGTVAFGKNPSNVLHSLSLDSSGFLNVNIAAGSSNASVGPTASAVPAFASFVGVQDDAGNLRGVKGETAANPNLRVAIYSGGNLATVTGQNALTVTDLADTTANTTTAPTKIMIAGGKTNDGTPQYQALPLSSGGAALIVTGSGTFNTNDSNAITQGSTTSGEKGFLEMGAVTTSAPSYSNGQSSPLSLTTSGFLRVALDSEVNANGSTAVPTNAVFVGAKGADGFLHALTSSTNDGKLDVNASFSGSVTTDFVVDRVQSGAITAAAQTVVLNTKGAASLVFNITGTWNGTLQFEALMPDLATWVPITCYQKFPGSTGASSLTQNSSASSQWAAPVGGVNQFRVRASSFSSGTANVNLEVGAGGLIFEMVQITAANLNATAVQGNAGSAAQSWFTKVTDGTNVFGVSAAHPFVTQDISDGAPGTASQPSTAMQVAGWDGTHLRVLSTDAAGVLNVNASIGGTFTPALTADRGSTGTITANGQSITLNTQGCGACIIQFTGTWNGTVQFEANPGDGAATPSTGANWYSINAFPMFVGGAAVTSRAQNSSASTVWVVNTGGVNAIRVRSSAWTSGTLTVTMEGGAGPNYVYTLSQISDGTNGPVAVKVSTVPVSSDAALTVALSPNSTQFATSTTVNALPGVNPITVGTGSTAVLNSNASRKSCTIINVGTTVIYLGLGATPTTTNYHYPLSKSTVAHDGTGGSWTSDMFKGTINAISSSAGGLVVVVEMT